LQPGRVDYFAGALASDQLSFEEVPLTAAPGGSVVRLKRLRR
jgi:hypothetical protein